MIMNGPDSGSRVIGITGMPGSGKGEACIEAREIGIPVRSMGDVVRSFFASGCPGRDPKETGRFADEERKRFGKDIWALRLIEEVEELISRGEKLVIIDGVRSSFEVDVFKTRWGDGFSILSVHSSPRTRFHRLLNRGRSDDPGTRKEFDERDDRELGWGLGDVIARADIMMVNESGMHELKKDFKELLERMME